MFVDFDTFLDGVDRKSWAWRNLIGQTTNVFVSERTTTEVLAGTSTPLSSAGFNGYRANGITGGFYDLLVNGTRYGTLFASAAVGVEILTQSGIGLLFNTNGVGGTGWQINSSGHFLALTDASFDIGASGATRPRNVYISGTLTSGGALAASNITAWATWTPTRTGWTDIGAAPAVTARYCQVGNVIHFQVKVVPGTTTATTAGTSYISLPVSMGASSLAGDGSFMDNTTFISIGPCVFNPANSRCYVPTQAATGDTLTIAGWYEV